MDQSNRKGVLYIVATPIGNLEDITYRAVRVLKEADLIACEDTRHTRKLLGHYGIARPVISYHEHNEGDRARELASRLLEGLTIAQVSDAGMPGICDPGYRLVELAIECGIPVVPIPGPSALIAALSAGGLSTDAFEFRGFLPARSGQRKTALEALRNVQHTVVMYEAPHRIAESIEDIVRILGPARRLVVARELTKVHEEFLRATAGEIAASLGRRELKGEITLLIGKAESPQASVLLSVVEGEQPDLSTRLRELMCRQQLDEKAALKVLAKESGRSKSELYRELQRNRAIRGT